MVQDDSVSSIVKAAVKVNEKFGVKVIYRNEKLVPVCEKTYPLRDYTDMLKNDLLRLITDLEDVFYMVNDNKPKEEWSDSTWAAFSKLKHKILDKAGAISRLPDGLISYGKIEDGEQEIGNFIKSLFREGNDM